MEAKAETFETFVARERERLESRRQELVTKRSEIEDEIEAVDREMSAINAYEAAKRGRPVQQSRTSTRAPRGERRKKIVELIKEAQDGLSRGEIIEAMGVKGDKAGEGSISNALTAMKKANTIAAQNGKYVLPQ